MNERDAARAEVSEISDQINRLLLYVDYAQGSCEDS
ncbi:hypothetical protein ATJ93_4626 [Halopiger aswanensis]|uniref:Uncharacterized protein n=1 Tax=Halopiger aswanensis TaxID=148449 RepID=A0A3R7GEZ1_9EURY|nr:hypothetical protein ATJ93_4626 [Halopiger aswanensis]